MAVAWLHSDAGFSGLSFLGLGVEAREADTQRCTKGEELLKGLTSDFLYLSPFTDETLFVLQPVNERVIY